MSWLEDAHPIPGVDRPYAPEDIIAPPEPDSWKVGAQPFYLRRVDISQGEWAFLHPRLRSTPFKAMMPPGQIIKATLDAMESLLIYIRAWKAGGEIERVMIVAKAIWPHRWDEAWQEGGRRLRLEGGELPPELELVVPIEIPGHVSDLFLFEVRSGGGGR